MLLQHQSIDEFIARLADPTTTVVVSLSSQSIVSLAAAYDIQPAECVVKITAVLKQHGVKAVFDVSWARDVALLEAAAEFIDRYRQRHHATPSQDVQMDDDNDNSNNNNKSAPLPMLASACPGWVCYAEKTHGTFALPYISTTKSPQAVMGSAVKQHWAAASGIDPAVVYHCAVMPCYDKKLEAVRDDFHGETDSVLATTELHDWITRVVGPEYMSNTTSSVAAKAAMLDSPFTNQVAGGHGQSYGSPGGSGGYAEYILRSAAHELFGVDLTTAQEEGGAFLQFISGRNADIKECSVMVNGQRVLHFATAYGFRNIQGLMRKVKLGKCEYDYVEVMACPSGCLNGGGQKKAAPGQSVQQLIEQLETQYHSGAYLEPRLPQLNASVESFYRDVVRGVPGSDAARHLLHTQYHKLEKTVASAIADW